MAVSYVAAGRLASSTLSSTHTFTGVTLPSGRLLLCFGWRAGADRSVVSITHPALTSVTGVLTPTSVINGSQAVKLAAYDCQSSGGTGDLVFTFTSSVWAMALHTLSISGVATGVGAATSTPGSDVASVQLVPTRTGAALGVSVTAVIPVSTGATLSVTGWNDITQVDSTNSGALHLFTSAEETSPSGQTLTASMSSGNMTAVILGALLFDPVVVTGSNAAMMMG